MEGGIGSEHEVVFSGGVIETIEQEGILLLPVSSLTDMGLGLYRISGLSLNKDSLVKRALDWLGLGQTRKKSRAEGFRICCGSQRFDSTCRHTPKLKSPTSPVTRFGTLSSAGGSSSKMALAALAEGPQAARPNCGTSSPTSAQGLGFRGSVFHVGQHSCPQRRGQQPQRNEEPTTATSCILYRRSRL